MSNGTKFGKFAIPVLFILIHLTKESLGYNCSIPYALRGSWFSLENDTNTLTYIENTTMTNKGVCIAIKNDFHVNYTMVFKGNSCYICVKLTVRNANVLDKAETSCINVSESEATIGNVCSTLNLHESPITLFSEDYAPVSCQSSFQGVMNFAYLNRFKFTGECGHPDARISSCQRAGSEFAISNQKFNVTYKKCEGMIETFDAVVEYTCLGDWLVGNNHYFAVVNTKESSKDKKYRCFLRNRDDSLYIGVSSTADCSSLKTVEQSPELLHLYPMKPRTVEPNCVLPKNFTGDWIDTANLNDHVSINLTHIITTRYYDGGFRRKIYVCREKRDMNFMMARLTAIGCEEDYICFDFVPRRHNIIRYRTGIATANEDFHTVCSSAQFQNRTVWKYDLLLKKDPAPIRCPVGGTFNFTRNGDFPSYFVGNFHRHVYCQSNVSTFSVCDSGQKEIAIVDNSGCVHLVVDHVGRPLNIYRDPDYKIKCIGYWKENLKSYIITYNELDPWKYNCWVYEKSDSNRILMSQAIGPFCDLKQNATSWNQTEGAAVSIEMHINEDDHNPCPMHFDDGSDV